MRGKLEQFCDSSCFLGRYVPPRGGGVYHYMVDRRARQSLGLLSCRLDQVDNLQTGFPFSVCVVLQVSRLFAIQVKAPPPAGRLATVVCHKHTLTICRVRRYTSSCCAIYYTNILLLTGVGDTARASRCRPTTIGGRGTSDKVSLDRRSSQCCRRCCTQAQ